MRNQLFTLLMYFDMNKDHQYILETGSRKHICINCGKKTAVRYKDKETGAYLPEQYSRCDREVNCAYHLNPYKDGFAKAIKENKDLSRFLFPSTKKMEIGNAKKTDKPVTFIPFDILKQSRHSYEQNTFIQFLTKLFGVEETNKLIGKYFIGTSNDCFRKETGYWLGATIFWFIDIKGRIRAGQVKLFDENGHTAKYINREGDKASCTDGIHTPLKWSYQKKKEHLPEWLANYIESKKIFCFFGEHLLKDKTKPIAIVEAPKTAIIASVYLPQFIWIAVGALSYLTEERCKALYGRDVILYPDVNAYEKWYNRALELSHIANFKISDYLEATSTQEERQQGIDLADRLIRYNFNEYELIQEYPTPIYQAA
ncbi:DUF6371 domain-containing protein [Adhaeribacter radiodurans]|uniref:DUF3854 domain-containing protein n=1 Tax=Adhaeribacter radiodurans TaxID=2745197 RepID=A0A7L7LBQ2_9BACT|nr:DUF6371 domain-containing protein [Adhaeribacter radiodurans]QMU30134.1 hypothetical protein HUW48_19810 [Adhaeribacter radiodurans]